MTLLQGLPTAPSVHSVERLGRATTASCVGRSSPFGRLELLVGSEAAYSIIRLKTLVLLCVAHLSFLKRGGNRKS